MFHDYLTVVLCLQVSILVSGGEVLTGGDVDRPLAADAMKEELTVHLQPSSSSQQINVLLSVTTVHLICPHRGSPWLLPNSWRNVLQNDSDSRTRFRIHDSDKPGSLLTIHLPKFPAETRAGYRGFYRCCHHDGDSKDVGDRGSLMQLEFPQPSCCPCCPWYEQEQCLSQTSDKHQQQCHGVFLFTGHVDKQPVRLFSVYNQPLLIPCPSAYHPASGDAERPVLTLLHRPVGLSFWMPWLEVRAKGASDVVVSYAKGTAVRDKDVTYDPRYGLCLSRSQLARQSDSFTCEHSGGEVKRVVEFVVSSSQPLLPPNTSVWVVVSVPREIGGGEFPSVQDQVTLSGRPSDISQGNIDSSQAIIRVKGDEVLQLRCIASYSNTEIISLSVDKLCFQWKLLELTENHTEATMETVPWTPTKCLDTILDANRSLLHATSRLSVPVKRHAVLAECNVHTPSRLPPGRKKSIRLLPQTAGQRPLEMNWRIRTFDRTELIKQMVDDVDNTTTVILGIRNDSHTQLVIDFWTRNEVGKIPFCKLAPLSSHGVFREDFPNPTIQPSTTVSLIGSLGQSRKSKKVYRSNRHIDFTNSSNASSSASNQDHPSLHVYRGKDSWKCLVFTSHSTTGQKHLNHLAQVGLHDATLLPVSTRSFSIHSFNLNYSSRLLLTGLQPRVQVNSRLECRDDNLERPLPTRNTTYTWKIRFDNRTVEKYATNYSHLFYPAIMPNGSGGTNVEFVREGNSTLSPLSALTHKWPSWICAECAVTYFNVITDTGPEKCVRLGNEVRLGGGLNKGVRLRVDPLERVGSLVNGLRLDSYNPEDAKLIWIEGEGMALTCSQSDSNIDLSRGHSINISEWPQIFYSTELHSNQQGEVLASAGIMVTWSANPYMLTTKMEVSKVRKIQTEGHFICKVGIKHAQLSVSVISPQIPIILNPKENEIVFATKSKNLLLRCSVEAIPPPHISWEFFSTNSTSPGIIISNNLSTSWKSLRHCAPQLQFTSSTTNCTHDLPSGLLNVYAHDIIVRCTATNSLGVSRRSIRIRRVEVVATKLVDELHSKNNRLVATIVGVALSITIVFSLIVIALCCRSHALTSVEKVKCNSNILYSQPAHKWGLPGCPSTEQIPPHVLRSLTELVGTKHSPCKWLLPGSELHMTGIKLGSGHYGNVEKAWLNDNSTRGKTSEGLYKERTRLSVAVKTTSPELSSLTCLRNEISLLAEFEDCPVNIVTMLGLVVGQYSDLRDIRLVMEFCPNGSLSQFTKNHANDLYPPSYLKRDQPQSPDTVMTDLSPTSCVRHEMRSNRVFTSKRRDSKDACQLSIMVMYRIIHSVAVGIAYLAERGIIHRDLATRNILLSDDLEPKICDFGLAVTVQPPDNANDFNIANGLIRDEYYRILSHQKQLPFRILPLEVLTNQTFYLASDIWQFGLLIWQFFQLEQLKPFSELGTLDELSSHLHKLHANNIKFSQGDDNQPRTAPNGLERPNLAGLGLWNLLCAMWQLDHQLRPTAAQLVDHLETLLRSSESLSSNVAMVQDVFKPKELKYITCHPTQGDEGKNGVRKDHTYENGFLTRSQ